MNNEGLPIKMFVRLKEKGFLSSGLKEGCEGLIGIERGAGTAPRASWEGGPSPHSQVPALDLGWCSGASALPLGNLSGSRTTCEICVYLDC